MEHHRFIHTELCVKHTCATCLSCDSVCSVFSLWVLANMGSLEPSAFPKGGEDLVLRQIPQPWEKHPYTILPEMKTFSLCLMDCGSFFLTIYI